MNKFTKRVGFIAAAIAATTTVSVGFASWTASGNGNGKAASQAKPVLDVTAATGPTGDLYPGSQVGTVLVTVTNNEKYPVKLSSISAGTADAGMTACSISYLLTSRNVNGVTGVVLAANGGVVNLTLPAAVAMGNDPAEACAASTFTIPVTVSGASAGGATATTGLANPLSVP